MSHRQLARLAIAAALVLVLGLLVRSRLQRTSRAPPAAPPSEASALQQLSQEGLLRRASGFVAERTAAVERHLVYVAQSEASGVRWSGDTVFSTGRRRPVEVFASAAATGDTLEIRQPGDSIRNAWLLIVARAKSGATLSVSATAAGRVRTRCGSREVDEIILDVALAEAMAGAGVFDIDGALVGIVLRCGERLAAIPARQGASLVEAREATAELSGAFGASLAPLDSVSLAYFSATGGALVTAVRSGGTAQASGLRPGDVIQSVDGTAMTTPGDVSRIIASKRDSAYRITRVRGRTTTVLRTRPASGATAGALAPGLGMALTPDAKSRGVAVAGVQPGSAMYLAGMRPGDRLIRIGSADVASSADAERFLRAAAPGPVFVVFARGSVEYGVLVRR